MGWKETLVAVAICGGCGGASAPTAEARTTASDKQFLVRIADFTAEKSTYYVVYGDDELEALSSTVRGKPFGVEAILLDPNGKHEGADVGAPWLLPGQQVPCSPPLAQ